MLTRAVSVYYNRTYIGGPEIFSAARHTQQEEAHVSG